MGFIVELMNKIKPKNQGDVIKEMRRIGAGIKFGLGKEIRQLGVKIESVEHKVDLLAENQVCMGEKLDATFEMVGRSAVDLTVVKDSVELIKHDLKKKAGVDRFAVLER